MIPDYVLINFERGFRCPDLRTVLLKDSEIPFRKVISP